MVTSPLTPAAKVVGSLVFVVAVVALPRQTFWPYAVDGLIVLTVIAVIRLPPMTLVRRVLIEAPFIVFAVLLPLVGAPPHTEVLGLSLSVPGLWGAWSIVAKGTLGMAAAVVLASTTPPADLISGLERLRVPRVITVVAGFMVRYLDVVSGELRRLQIARVSRGDDPRWAWQAKATAATAGAMFVRSYERGERVHHAMVARGFTGTFPDPVSPTTTTGLAARLPALVPGLIAAVVTVVAWTTT